MKKICKFVTTSIKDSVQLKTIIFAASNALGISIDLTLRLFGLNNASLSVMEKSAVQTEVMSS